jgi:hypothetical protein
LELASNNINRRKDQRRMGIEFTGKGTAKAPTTPEEKLAVRIFEALSSELRFMSFSQSMAIAGDLKKGKRTWQDEQRRAPWLAVARKLLAPKE